MSIWSSLPTELHPVLLLLRFPSLNSERCRTETVSSLENLFAVRWRRRRTRPLIVTGNGRYPPKVRFWAEGNRSKKNPHPVPPSRRTTSDDDSGGVARSVAVSQTEAENLGMIMPPRHRLRRLDYVQGDTEEFAKPPVDSDLRCSVILPGQ